MLIKLFNYKKFKSLFLLRIHIDIQVLILNTLKNYTLYTIKY